MSRTAPKLHAAALSLLTTEEAAEYVRLSTPYLNKLRCTGGGPKFVKLGNRVRYRRESLEVWLLAHERENTSEAA